MNSSFAQRSGQCHHPARHASGMVNPSNVPSGAVHQGGEGVLAELLPVRVSPARKVDALEPPGLRDGQGHPMRPAAGVDAGHAPPVVEVLPAHQRRQRGGGDEAQLADQAAQRAAVDVRSVGGEHGDAAEEAPCRLSGSAGVAVEPADEQRAEMRGGRPDEPLRWREHPVGLVPLPSTDLDLPALAQHRRPPQRRAGRDRVCEPPASRRRAGRRAGPG